MPRTVSEFAKPIECVSTGLTLSDYVQLLNRSAGTESIVLIEGKRPIGLLSPKRFAKLLKYSAQNNLTPAVAFKAQQRKLPILPADLELQALWEKIDEAGLQNLQKGCLIASQGKLLGALDFQKLMTAMLDGLKEAAIAPEPVIVETKPATPPPPPDLQLGMLAHEIRTPLTGMIGLAELIERRVRDKEARAMTSSLIRTSRALDRLLTDTLDFASLKSGHFEIVSHPCNLMELVGDLQQVWSHEAAQRNLTYDVEFWPNGPHQISADLGRVRQIANNLISNALKFTETGGVTVSVSTQPLRDTLVLMLSVTDTGRGLAQDDQDRFQQVFEKSEAPDQTQGWGLGLTISHALAKKLDGELSYSENPAGGSVFSLTMPVETTPVNENGPGTRDRLRHGKFNLGEILVIEDHEASAMIALQILENAGWQVRMASSLDQAYSHLGQKSFQAILTDLHLPDGNALGLIESVRKHSTINADTPIIAMTADIAGARREECLAAGADRAIKKPLQGPALVACLADILMARSAKKSGAALRGRLAG